MDYKEKVVKPAKRFWNFVWNGDSWSSWAVFLIISFIFIKFIFFPLMSLITGTSLPLAIVESCSMYHEKNFEGWWGSHRGWYESRGISTEEFKKFPIKNGFTKGDIFLILGTDKSKIKKGDVIIFESGTANRPIIHRVINLSPLETKGDNNALQFNGVNNPEKIDETKIEESQIIGRVTVLRIPMLGWIKLIFFEPFRPASERGFCR